MNPIAITGPIGDGDGDGDGDRSTERHVGDKGDEGDKGDKGDKKGGADGAGEADDHRPNRKQPEGEPRREPREREHFIPSRDSLRAGLHKLLPLIATGALAPAQAREMRANLKTQLDEMPPDNPQAGARNVDTTPLRDALRQNPDLLNALEPLLSDDELRDLLDDDEEDEGDDQPDKKKG